jgi:predicted N-formylglutamate amidohydrolase
MEAQASKWDTHFRRWMPVALGTVGLSLVILSQFLVADVGSEAVISKLAGMILFVGGIISVVIALISFFLRDQEEIW